jgi:hypothetical protein
MAAQMNDDRRQADVVQDLSCLLRTKVHLAAHGWRDHDDADVFRKDPAMRLAVGSSAGLTPMTREAGLASQPTLSRCKAMLARPGNLKVLREGAIERAGRYLRTENGGQRRTRITLDFGKEPIEKRTNVSNSRERGHMEERNGTLESLFVVVHIDLFPWESEQEIFTDPTPNDEALAELGRDEDKDGFSRYELRKVSSGQDRPSRYTKVTQHGARQPCRTGKQPCLNLTQEQFVHGNQDLEKRSGTSEAFFQAPFQGRPGRGPALIAFSFETVFSRSIPPLPPQRGH